MNLDTIDLRNALGRFATGVCVVTCTPKAGQPLGMTVNSFSSLSLEPALLLWSLQKNSDLAETWANATQFAVNILSSNQQALSNTYAKSNDHDLRANHYTLGKTGSPVLIDCLASFECNVSARHDGGDHIIMVGEIVEMNACLEADPLLFYSGQYRELG